MACAEGCVNCAWIKHNEETWAAYTRQREATMSSHGQGPEHEAYAMGCHCVVCRPNALKEDVDRVYRMTRFGTKEEYEAYVRRSRAKAQWERIARRIKIGLGVAVAIGAILGLLVLAQRASAAPLADPKTGSEFQRGLKEPDASPRKGITIEDAKNACEQHGGHWFQEDPDDFPQGRIIGCLFLVPRGSK